MMASQDVYVGIDVSKDRLDVHVRPLEAGFRCAMKRPGMPRWDRFFVPTSAQRGAARRRGQDGPQATAAGGAQRA